MAAVNYALGGVSRDPDVVVYDLCEAFGKLPSEIEEESPLEMEKLMIVHYAVQAQKKRKVEEAERNARG